MFLTLAEGRHYQLRCGEIITIVRQDGEMFVGNNTRLYDKHGETAPWSDEEHVLNIDREVVVNDYNIAVVEVPSFPEGCNPFHYDHANMGCDISGSWMGMFSGHAGFKRGSNPPERYPDPECIYLVNTKTGRRFRLDLRKANKSNSEIKE